MVKAKVNLGNKTHTAKKNVICKSCGMSGHATAKSKQCPDNPANQKQDFNAGAEAKKLVKAEKVQDAIDEAGVGQDLSDAHKKLKEMEEALKQHKAEMVKQIEEQKQQVKQEEEKAKQLLEEKWKQDNQEAKQKYEADLVKYFEEKGINDTPDTRKLYSTFREFKEPPKPWIKRQRKKGGGGGGGGKAKPKPTDKCQARLFYSFKGKWVRPDFCGCEKVAGSDFCKKHKDQQPDGVMGDGKKPERYNTPEFEGYFQELITNEKYGDENKKQMGL